MIDRMNYVQTAARVKVEEKKLLNMAKLNSMIDSEDAKDILKILSETDYSKSMVGVSTEQDFYKILQNQSKKVYALAEELVKDCTDCVKILELKNIFQNLKFTLKKSIKEKTNSEISDEYLEEYTLASKEYEKTNDVQLAMILLDRLYFKKLKTLCDKINLEILNEYYTLALKSYNLLTFLRLKNQKRTYKYAQNCLIDDENLLKIYNEESNYIQTLEKYFEDKHLWATYAKTKSIASIEKELDNLNVKLIKKYKNVNYGIEPVVTYVLAKEYEMKAIRLIITGKINKIPNDVIRERLREIYV